MHKATKVDGQKIALSIVSTKQKEKEVVLKDLELFCQQLYKEADLPLSQLIIENDNKQSVLSLMFQLGPYRCKFRTAKTTPTKIGQFVTFYKKVEKKPILPYHVEDPFDLLIISCRFHQRFGQFIFPKSLLSEQGILCSEKCAGKRAMRVYPIWELAENAQAKKSQKWQLGYFFSLSNPNSIANFKELVKKC